MNKIKLENLYQLNYSAEVLNALKQQWHDGDSYNFWGNKKKQHLFSFFLNCSAIYTFKDGETIFAPPNSIVYTPEGSEYKVTFKDCDTSGKYNCIAINFMIYDENNIPFCFADNIKIYSPESSSQILKYFHEIADNYQFAVHSPMKITGLFYIMLSDMSSYYRTKRKILPKYNMIAKGISAIENQCINDIKVSELARMCNISPVYFRRLFKEYAGISPLEYKLNAIIAQAKQYLLFSDKSIAEISDILGFSTPTYFSRIFRKKTGMSPAQFIKNKSDN